MGVVPATSGPSSAPVRVLLVDTEEGWRGGQQQVLLLARGLAGHPRFRGEAVTVCRRGSELAQRIIAAGLPCRAILGASPWSPRSVFALRSLARELDAGIVHAHASHAHTLSALATFGTGRRLLATRRVSFTPRGLWKYRRCTRVVAISQAIAGVLRGQGIPADRLEVIPSGIDPARFALADRGRGRASLGLADGDLAVLCVAALEDEKDHRTLLAAWRGIAAARPRAHLLLAGEGGLRGELTALAADLPRVRFLGFRNDIPDLLAAADAFVLASHHEGLGTAVMDAMCCRLPVVATRAGGIPELVRDDQDGLLVPERDPAAFAQALARILDDPALRVRLGAAAAATASDRFHAPAMVEAYVGVYNRMLGDG